MILFSLTLESFGSWLANLFGCYGAFESSKPSHKLNPIKMNFLFSISNLSSLIYFMITLQYPYLILQSVFLVLSLRGILNNIKRKRESTEIKNLE